MIPKKMELKPGDLVRITQERTVYSSVEMRGTTGLSFYNIFPSDMCLFMSQYSYVEEVIDVVLLRGKTLHVAHGVLERIQ